MKPTRKPFDHKIQHLRGDYYQVWWTQPRDVGMHWIEVRTRRIVNLAAAERFAAKHGVEMPQRKVEA